jgi:glycosyltransferase involved in cell wall biosynthesis
VTPGRAGLSVAIITRDEAADLPACLASVRWADEVVVCDTGSRDATCEIAAACGARVFRDAWRGFAAHKALAVGRCGQPWVLVLDADERVSPELRREIEALLADPAAADGYAIPRRSYFLGREVRYGGWSPDYCLRLFRAGRARVSDRLVHEAFAVPSGRVGRLRGRIEHYTYASLADYLERMGRYADLGAQQLRRDGRRARVADLLLRPPLTFARMLLLRQGWRDGVAGVVLAGLYACSTFVKYACLWEREQKGTEPGGAPEGGDADGAAR